MLREWLVAADDRTGAMEVAAELAVPGRPVPVTVWQPPAGDGVVDLATRAMRDPAAAAEAVRGLPQARWRAQKIDSTLRGHWPAELAGHRRVLMLPAWPAMGRTCVGGVVHVHGRPHSAVRDRRPDAVVLPGLDALEGWLAAGTGIAVADVVDTAALAAVASTLATADPGGEVLVAGSAGAIGAVHRARCGVATASVPPPIDLSAATHPVVVCASATDTSAAQLDRVAALLPHVEVHRAAPADGTLDGGVARRLADAVRDRIALADLLVVIGGDTVAAVLGDAPRLVGGHAAPGMPWSLDEAGGGPLVVTKAGGFGDADALVRLLTGETV